MAPLQLIPLLGYATLFILGVLVARDAYKEKGFLHAFLVWIIPLYALYWLFFRVDNRGKMISVWLVGSAMVLAPAFMLPHGLGTTAGACSLLTSEQVAAELDGPFNEGKSYETLDMVGCRYTKTDVASKSLVVVPRPCSPTDLSSAELGRNDYKVHELGDDAMYKGGWLYARKGATCYAMGVEGIDPESTVERRKNLMRTMLAAVK